MVNTTICWIYSRRMVILISCASTSLMEILLTGGLFLFSVCWLSLLGSVFVWSICIWRGGITRRSRLIIFMGSRGRWRPSIRILGFMRLFLSCFVVCLWLIVSINRLWFVMVDCLPMMGLLWRTSRILLDLLSRLRKGWCVICCGLILRLLLDILPAREERLWVLDLMWPRSSWAKTIWVRNWLCRNVDQIAWDEDGGIRGNSRWTMYNHIQCTKLLWFFGQQGSVYQVEGRGHET